MISCKRLRLRPAQLADRSKIFQWLAHSEITPSIMGPPMYPDHHIPSWEEFVQDYDQGFFIDSSEGTVQCFIIVVGDTEIGMISFSDLDTQSSSVDLDIWMKAEEFCGHGYGPEALNCLVEHLHSTRGVRSFRVDPSARNTRAIRAYEKAGFKRDSTYRWNRTPDYRDAISMVKEMAPNQAL